MIIYGQSSKFKVSFFLTCLPIIGTGSSIYSGVGGGCMLSSLVNFPARQDKSALLNMDSQPVNLVYFYATVIRQYEYYWQRKINNPKEDEGKPVFVITNNPTIKMAGASHPVNSYEVEPAQFEDFKNDYLSWVSYAHAVFEDPYLSTDTCIDES